MYLTQAISLQISSINWRAKVFSDKDYSFIFIPNIFLTTLKMNKRQRVYTIKFILCEKILHSNLWRLFSGQQPQFYIQLVYKPHFGFLPNFFRLDLAKQQATVQIIIWHQTSLFLMMYTHCLLFIFKVVRKILGINI